VMKPATAARGERIAFAALIVWALTTAFCR
jgi:hypothetical protein